MKEYSFEGMYFDPKILASGDMKIEDYKKAHAALCIPCHDAFIEYSGGILLVKRTNVPAKDLFWPIGGRIKRGFKIEESLKLKVKKECGLDLKTIKNLGIARTLFRTDPFGHGRGTDTINLVFYAKGFGKIKLDNLHENPIVVTPEKYEEIKKNLHPFVNGFLKRAISLLK